MTPGRTLLAVFAIAGLMCAPAHAANIQIVIDDLVFTPVNVSARVGDTVEWINKDPFGHTATAQNRAWDVVIGPKKTGRLELKKAGDFDYFCRFHPNMKGKISVAP